MRQLIPTTLLGLALFAAMPAMAETLHEEQRDINQQERISNGIESGQLTARETARVEKGEARINRAENKATADGTITAAEQKHINRMQTKESHRIHRQKHDAQTN